MYHILALLALLFLPLMLQADEIDTLLQHIEKRTDLSEKTKLANSGVTFVWTRDDLDRMQVTSLKEILNTLYPIGYGENRYGLSDPLTNHSAHPAVSGVIRVYIDNQEISTGFYGSGIVLLGDANIDWVDHVEIYTQNPTFEYATESTMTLIKLYSKSVAKDEGSKLNITTGSYGKHHIYGYHAGWLGEWSYFFFGYDGNEKRQKYRSHDTTLSRDKKVKMATATLRKDQTTILLHALSQKGDAFAHLSLDATPKLAKIGGDYLHIGIDSSMGDFSYLLSYSYSKFHSKMEDDVTPIPTPPFNGLFPYRSIDSSTHDYVFTGETKYKTHFKNDTLLTGVKYRYKKGVWGRSKVNGTTITPSRDTYTQTLNTLYLEDQHLLSPSSLLTAGIERQQIQNKDTVQNDTLWLYRLSHTYTTEAWTLKSFYSHTLTSLELYMIESVTFLSNPFAYHNPQTIDTWVENMIYTKGSDTFELIADYTRMTNAYLPQRDGKIGEYEKILKMMGIDLRWTKHYRVYDKLFVGLSYREAENIPVINTLKVYQAIFRSVNSVGKWDIFNELVYSRDNIFKTHFFNYSLGLQYHYSDDISLSLKGNNLFDKARQYPYYRLDPQTFQYEKPLRIPPMDSEIHFGISWVF